MKKLLFIIFIILFLMTNGLVCYGKVQKFTTVSIQEQGTYTTGAYIIHKGKIVGELETDEAIPGLALADEDKDGRVQYQTEFTLTYPKEEINRNGTLLFDVENRGRPNAFYLYNTSRSSLQGESEPADVFLQDQGFMHVTAGWELGHSITLPSFTDKEGRVNYIEGVGFAVVRDIAVFLKSNKKNKPEGEPNPLNGTVKQAIGVGYSQTARFLKSFLIHGFNTNSGKPVFDGIHLQAGHSGLLPILAWSPGPNSSSRMFPTFTHPDIPGVHQPPFTYAAICKIAKEGGVLLPKIIVTNMAGDYYTFRASLARTGPVGSEETPIPENVRIYDIAGSAHTLINAPGCKYARGHLDWHPVMRAVLLRLDDWIKSDRLPPESNLMPLESQAGNPLVLGPPKMLPQAVIMIPKRDIDGNDLGGIRLPEVEVPLGTFAGQNEPLENIFCTLSGAFIPFEPSLKIRKASGDKRISLEERYKNKDDYVKKIRAAVDEIVKSGFMLEKDAKAIVKSAKMSDVF